MSGTCLLSYSQEGEPFSIVLEEAGVKTTCNLVTYLPESPDDIPFDIEDLSFKIITQARWLLDALAELVPTSPDKLTIVATKTQPYLRLSSAGPLGSSSVDFARGRELLETFTVHEHFQQTYKFDMIKSASEAMRISSKVSLRGDRQGVLSMQFMVEVEGGGVNFLDFRFVPYAVQEEDYDEEGNDSDVNEAF
jgi:cell cycle checkpoint protein